jgi:hypothetical protein
MDHMRSAWVGSHEILFQTWSPGSRLQYAHKPNYPEGHPTVLGFRLYTKHVDGSDAIGQLEDRATSLGLDEEEAAELARQEYFYSQKQLDQEVDNLIFATATSGEMSVIIRIEDIGDFILEHSDCIFVCLNAAVDFILLKTFFSRDSETHESASQTWDLVADECRLRDLYILDGLVRLGLEDGRTLARPIEEIVKEFSSFGVVQQQICPRRLAPSVSAIYSAVPIPPHEDSIASGAVADVVMIQSSYLAMLLIALRIAAEHRSEMFQVAPVQYGPLSEGVQVKGSIVLYEITKNGIAIDKDLAKKVQAKLEERLSNSVDELMKDEKTRGIFQIQVASDGSLYAAREGAKPKIDVARLEELLAETAAEITSRYQMDMVIPRIAGGGLSRAPRTWSEYSHLSSFLKTWIDMEQAAHFNAFLSHLKEERAHPQYTIMVRNGRTSAQNPPIQQTPRKGGYREMFRASPGHVLVAIDYEFIELCTLAAVCLARYGNSILAQVICQGVDPHAFTASMIEGVSLHEFMSWKTSPDPELKAKFTNLRQRAKAVNFGIPSGLTAAGLSLYAKGAYGVDFPIEEAEKFRTALIKDVYPELSKYLEEGDMERLSANLGVSMKQCWSAFTFKSKDQTTGKLKSSPIADDRKEAVEGGMRNIVRGSKFRKRDGKEYNPFFVKKVWSGLKRLAKDPRHFQMIHEAQKQNQGSETLYKELFGRPVTTLTGRVRGKVGFTQACNTPFSGLAADGAKLAMWNLYLLGYKLIGFIHDEVLLEIPETADGTYDAEAAIIKDIMIQSMKELTGPIPVGVQLSVSHVWSKEAFAVHNEKGQLIPWVSQKDPTETS